MGLTETNYKKKFGEIGAPKSGIFLSPFQYLKLAKLNILFGKMCKNQLIGCFTLPITPWPCHETFCSTWRCCLTNFKALTEIDVAFSIKLVPIQWMKKFSTNLGNKNGRLVHREILLIVLLYVFYFKLLLPSSYLIYDYIMTLKTHWGCELCFFLDPYTAS